MDMDITVLRFKLRAKEDIKLPEHPGSTFRGAFGHGLYNICCSLKKKQCDKCNLKSACAYSLLFNPFLTGKEKENSSNRFHNKPRPFIIKYPMIKDLYSKGEIIEFDIHLFGYLNNFIPFIIESWRYLQEEGIGANRGEFLLDAVWMSNEIRGVSERVFHYEDNKINNRSINVISNDIKVCKKKFEGKNKINLLFETPILLKYQSNYVKKIEFSILIKNIFRRLSSLSCFYGEEQLDIDFKTYIAESENINIENDQTKWIHWKRLSNRQSRKIDMYGLTGEITYTGDIDRFLEYLIWGQYTNVGKNTAFAQGAYRVLG